MPHVFVLFTILMVRQTIYIFLKISNSFFSLLDLTHLYIKVFVNKKAGFVTEQLNRFLGIISTHFFLYCTPLFCIFIILFQQ